MRTIQRAEPCAGSTGSRRIHIAVVSTTDGIVFAAAAPTPEALQTRLVAYIEGKASTVLWPDDAARVAELLARDRPDPAIDLYFARVGERWDAEHLHRQVVAFE